MYRMISLLGCLVVLMIGLAIPSALAFNKMLYSDGDGDYVEIVDSPILNGLDTQITIEAWINPDCFPNDWMSIVYKADECCEVDNVHRSFSLWLHHNGFIHFTSTFIGSEPILLLLNSPSGSIQLGTWYHVAGVIDTVNHNMTLLINGHEVASGSSGDSIRTSTLPLKIGSSQEPHPSFSEFAGYLDEVRIWNIARTQEEIQDNMDKPLEQPELLPNLVGYWNFDDGTGNDLSQYGNHGTLKGGARLVNTIYVSLEGSDTTGDGSADNPYRTIQKGIDESGRKDIVQVLPGVYEENIELLSDLIVLGSGAEKTTITAESGNIVTAHNVYNVSLSGFTLDGQGSADNGIVCSGTTSEMEINNNVITGVSMVGIACSDSVNVAIRSNTIGKSGIYGIRCGGSAHAIVENNTIRQNVQAGVECADSTDITIDNNNLEENILRGVQCNGNAKVSIMNNNIRRNQDRGISCWNTANVTIQYNVISQNNWAAYCADSSVVTITDNLIYNNQAPEIVLAGSSNTTIIRNIIHNYNVVIHCHEQAQVLLGGSLINSNNITAGMAIYNWSSSTINATYNYWGTTDESEIAAMMRNNGEGSIVFKPFINTLDEIVADTSGDGTISAYDAALILQYVVGLIDQFPATNPIGQVAQKYIAGDITIDELDRILQSFGYPSVFKLLGYENKLLQNYPNPFNPETWIPFKLAPNASVAINIYDSKGKLLRTIALGNRTAGIYTTKDRAAYWDGKDNLGQKVSSGVYYYTLQAGDFTATRKMVIMK